MTTDLAVRSTPDVMTLGPVFAKSGYFQDARDAAQAVVKMLAGQELGFGPVASMTGIYIVKGRVTLSANLLAAAVKKGGKYNYRVVELSDAACKIDFYEGKEKIGESAFSMEDAKVAGLVTENYKKFARNMLFARAMSNGAKWFCADVFSGPVYTPDELGATIDMETGEMLARPEDERVAVPPQPAQPEVPVREPSAEDLFAPPEQVDERKERAAYMGKIRAISDEKNISAKERRILWSTHAGVASPETVSLDALGNLLDAVQKYGAGA